MNAYLSTGFHETFGVGIAKPRSLLPRWHTLFSAPFSAAKRTELIGFLRLNQRPNIIWNIKSESLIKRTAIIALMFLALTYKRWFLRG